MLKKLKELRALNAFAKKQSVGMQRKLMLYWLSMIMAVFALVILLLSVAGTFSREDDRLNQVLNIQMQNADDQLTGWLDHLTAQGLSMSKTLSREIETFLEEKGVALEQLNDRPELLLELQETLYAQVNTTLQTADCSGAYVVLDATTNTGADTAGHSRSGLYLRYATLSTTSPVDSSVTYFRGIPDVAWQKGLELHNRWNLEFDIDQIAGYADLVSGPVSRPADQYYWTARTRLKDTWESAMLLCVPIVGSNQTVYGVCGVEVSALYFQLSCPVALGQFGSTVTVLAPIQDNRLVLGQGLVGGVSGTYLEGQETFSIHQGRYFNTYLSESGQYIGLQTPIPISKEDTQGLQWAVAILLPQESYAAYNANVRQTWIIAALAFLLVLLAISFFLSRRFVRPIVRTLSQLQQGEAAEGTMLSGISEIDDLAQFLSTRDQSLKLAQGELPPNIAEMFDHFAERGATLTEAERNILRYYIEGHEIAEIPDLAFISMSTVRKHNRSIYEKMGVASRDELMLYIDLFRRCGRLQELL